jgi:hypothetical protein
MAPVPELWNPFKGIQQQWAIHGPTELYYRLALGALSTIFGMAGVVGLVMSHGWKPPRWPFTKERWNPKPDVDDEEDEEAKKEKDKITEDEILADELAQVAGGLAKRELDFETLLDEDLELLSKRDGIILSRFQLIFVVLEDFEHDPKGFVDNAKNKTNEIVEHGKSGIEEIEEEFGKIVEAAEKVGTEIWDDVKGIIDGGKEKGEEVKAKGGPKVNKTEKVVTKWTNSTTRAPRRRREFHYVL